MAEVVSLECTFFTFELSFRYLAIGTRYMLVFAEPEWCRLDLLNAPFILT